MRGRRAAPPAAWLAAAFFGACSSHSDTPSLTPGTYNVDAPVCVSTGAAPAYPSPSFRLALFDFDGLTSRTWNVALTHVAETYVSPTCTLTALHGVYRNYDGVYSTMHGRHFGFSPAGCSMSVTAAGVTVPASAATTDQLKDSDDTTEEVLYSVEPQPDHTVRLESYDASDLDSVWASYGCAKSDRIRFVLHPIST